MHINWDLGKCLLDALYLYMNLISASTSSLQRVQAVFLESRVCFVYIVCLCGVYIMYYDRIMSVIYVLGGGVVGNLTISLVIYNCILVHVLTRYYIF